jgi:hypothetical protein
MSADDPQAIVQWREALLWLTKADADISGARALLAGGSSRSRRFPRSASAGKGAEGASGCGRTGCSRTHDIEQLATLAREHWRMS